MQRTRLSFFQIIFLLFFCVEAQSKDVSSFTEQEQREYNLLKSYCQNTSQLFDEAWDSYALAGESTADAMIKLDFVGLKSRAQNSGFRSQTVELFNSNVKNQALTECFGNSPHRKFLFEFCMLFADQFGFWVGGVITPIVFMKLLGPIFRFVANRGALPLVNLVNKSQKLSKYNVPIAHGLVGTIAMSLPLYGVWSDRKDEIEAEKQQKETVDAFALALKEEQKNRIKSQATEVENLKLKYKNECTHNPTLIECKNLKIIIGMYVSQNLVKQ